MTPTHIGILTYDLMKVNFLVHLSDFSEPFSMQYISLFSVLGASTDMRTSRTEIRAGGAWYRTFSFVVIHVCVQKMLCCINMKKMLQISGREGWFHTNPSLLVQYLASFFFLFVNFTSLNLLCFSTNFFPFRLNKEKRNTKCLIGGFFWPHSCGSWLNKTKWQNSWPVKVARDHKRPVTICVPLTPYRPIHVVFFGLDFHKILFYEINNDTCLKIKAKFGWRKNQTS